MISINLLNIQAEFQVRLGHLLAHSFGLAKQRAIGSGSLMIRRTKPLELNMAPKAQMKVFVCQEQIYIYRRIYNESSPHVLFTTFVVVA